jgi:hypothetical protein
MPGDRDSPDALRHLFANHAHLFAAANGEAPMPYRIDARPLTLIAFDCTVPGQRGGRLDPDALRGCKPRWLSPQNALRC